MAQQTQTVPPAAANRAVQHKSVEQLLDEVTNEINTFEARKLTELKSELEAVKKKKETAVAEYASKYEALKSRWCDQNDRIRSVRSTVVNAVPNWKQHVADCVCSALSEKRRFENLLVCRSEVKGPLESSRDKAAAARDAAKAIATGWDSAFKTLDAQLSANKDLIEGLAKDVQNPSKLLTVIYGLWFKVLPVHAGIAPETECFDVKTEEMPEVLCPLKSPPDTTRVCAQFEATASAKPASNAGATNATNATNATSATSATSATNAANASGAVARESASNTTSTAPPAKWPQSQPWIIPPDRYAAQLDDAYAAYLEAKKAFAIEEAHYKVAPDNLAQVKKDFDALLKRLDASITECLANKTDKGCCEKETEPSKPTGQDANDQPKKTGDQSNTKES
jgi:hypothetical protein